MKKMIKIKKIVGLVLVVVMCSIFCLTVSAADVQQKTDSEIVNEYAVAHGGAAIPEDAKALMVKDGNWDKVVKFVKGDKSTSYKVQFLNGGCAISSSKDSSIKVRNIPNTQSTTLRTPNLYTINSVWYWREDFNVNLLVDVYLADTSISYGNMGVHCWYKTYAVHSYNMYQKNGTYWNNYYQYSHDSSSYLYEEILWTGIPNGTYGSKIDVDYTGNYNYLYGDMFDVAL